MHGKIRSLNHPPRDNLKRDDVLAREETLCNLFLHMTISILRQKKDERSKKIPSVIRRINVQLCMFLCLCYGWESGRAVLLAKPRQCIFNRPIIIGETNWK